MKILSSLFLVLALSSILIAGELEDRKNIQDNVRDLFLKEKFDVLSEMAEKYLKSEERTSSGIWKLSLFDGGIGMAAYKETLDENHWADMENRAIKWVQQHPKSPSGYLAYAQFLIMKASQYRGTGFAREVKKENWKPFYLYLDQANKYLDKHYAIVCKDPRYYEAMIAIAKGGKDWDKESFEAVFNEGVSKFPYFYEIYFSAFNYLLPQWHGSIYEIEQLAQKAVELTKQKEKTSMYARIYWYAYQVNYRGKLFKETAVSWPTMSKSMDDVLELYPDQWNINNFARLACSAADKRKTFELFNLIHGEPIQEVWKDFKFYNECKEWSKDPAGL